MLMLDACLAVVADLVDAVNYRNDNNDQTTLTDAIVEAIDQWVCEIANEHHHSEPFTTSRPREPFAAAWNELIAAVAYLQHAGDMTITLAGAFQQAVCEWVDGLSEIKTEWSASLN